jgi:hypothetical protein
VTPPRTLVVPTGEFTDGLIEMLETALAKPVGDHKLPTDARLDIGYCIVHQIDGGEFDGPPLWAPEQEATLLFQVTSVAGLRGQAQWIADRVRLTLCSRQDPGGFQVPFPDPEGWEVNNREPEGAPPGVTPEGTEPSLVVFNVHERYRLSVAPTQ